jgi:hypothetical protein
MHHNANRIRMTDFLKQPARLEKHVGAVRISFAESN